MSNVTDRSAAGAPRLMMKNGATFIFAVEFVDGPDAGRYVVMANTEKMGQTEYATWRMDKLGNTFWGHYHDRAVDALDDVADRVRDYERHHKVRLLAYPLPWMLHGIKREGLGDHNAAR